MSRIALPKRTGLIAGLVYISKEGQRARCGWMCVGVSILSMIMGYVFIFNGS